MFYVSEIWKTPPKECKTQLQASVYETLEKLQIPYERVDTEKAVTMEDCIAINEKLDMDMVKTLFLCNRQQTAFYLFITCGDKPFRSKDFSTALHVSRVSFAPAGLLESMMGTEIGAATIFSALKDKEYRVRIVIDKDILKEEWYGCSDSTTTGYMKVKTEQIINRFLKYTGHIPTVIEV